MRTVLRSPARPRAGPPCSCAPAPSANRNRVVVEKRIRVWRFRRFFCKPTSLFRRNPASVCRRPTSKPLRKRWTDFRLREFMNFRTLSQSDPGVFRLSCTKVHELSCTKASPPRRMPVKQRGRPPKGAGRCEPSCLRESEGLGCLRHVRASEAMRCRLNTRKRGRGWRGGSD